MQRCLPPFLEGFRLDRSARSILPDKNKKAERNPTRPFSLMEEAYLPLPPPAPLPLPAPPSPPALPVDPALVPAALLPELLELLELPEPSLVLVPEVDFFALVLSPDSELEAPEAPEAPEVPEVPDVPDESVAPVMLPDEPVEAEPVPVDELCAIAMLLPRAETSSAIKSFFMYCLHR